MLIDVLISHSSFWKGLKPLSRRAGLIENNHPAKRDYSPDLQVGANEPPE